MPLIFKEGALYSANVKTDHATFDCNTVHSTVHFTEESSPNPMTCVQQYTKLIQAMDVNMLHNNPYKNCSTRHAAAQYVSNAVLLVA